MNGAGLGLRVGLRVAEDGLYRESENRKVGICVYLGLRKQLTR